jgi:uncharacterized membrane protein YeaQ/YmgE (transglycosylase-associated protein family)
MIQLRNFADSDLAILGVVAVLISSVLGLLSHVVMGERGFGPVRNSFVIFAGGLAGIFLRAKHYPVAANQELIASLVAAIIAATFALLAGSLVKKLIGQ